MVSLTAVSEQSTCKIMLMVKSRFEKESRSLPGALSKKEQKRSQSALLRPLSLSNPSPIAWEGAPPTSRNPAVCLADSNGGSSRQEGRVLRSPAEKLIHTLPTGDSLPPSHSPSGQAKSIRDFSQLVSEIWRSWHGFDTNQEVWAVWTAVCGTRAYTANVSPRREQKTKEWLRVIHPMLQLASSSCTPK